MLNSGTVVACVGRLALLKHFPSNNAEALKGLAEILMGLCPTDGDLQDLVAHILRDADEWPGPASVRRAYRDMVDERAAAAKRKRDGIALAAAQVKRAEHEKTCIGYDVEVDEHDETVRVDLCHMHFGEFEDWGLRHEASCRKGDEITARDPKFIERLRAQELAKRPGFVGYWERQQQRWEENRRKASNGTPK